MKKGLVLIIISGILAGIGTFYLFNKEEKEPIKVHDVIEDKIRLTVKENKHDFISFEYNDNVYKIYNPDFYEVNEGDILELNNNIKLDELDLTDISSYHVFSPDYAEKQIKKGIFSNYYALAYEKLQEMSKEERIGQILLVSYPGYNATNYLNEYHYGGYLFFAKDFSGKNKNSVINMMNNLQNASKIPLLTAVDEEGGGVVRVSSNPSLSSSRFKSPQALYREGGFELIKEDTKQKSELLSSLGININLAPVADVSENKHDYMYSRSLGLGAIDTGVYVKTVIEASKNGNVSYCLKHFPGYGNNADTHKGISVDTRNFNKISEDLMPFIEGINAGAEMVMVSHNIVNLIDKDMPSSLSSKMHELLRHELEFSGIIITDDISMGALYSIGRKGVLALTSGNDLIITGSVTQTFNEIKEAIDSGEIEEDLLNSHVLRVLAFKYYKGLL